MTDKEAAQLLLQAVERSYGVFRLRGSAYDYPSTDPITYIRHLGTHRLSPKETEFVEQKLFQLEGILGVDGRRINRNEPYYLTLMNYLGYFCDCRTETAFD